MGLFLTLTPSPFVGHVPVCCPDDWSATQSCSLLGSWGGRVVGSLDNSQCSQGWVLARSVLGYGRCRSGLELLGWSL